MSNELEEMSVNFIPVAGEGFNVQYLFQGRNLIKPTLPKGKYPFYYPGICCVWGGSFEPQKDKTPLDGILREAKEELHFDISPEQVSNSALRSYKWDECLVPLWQELDEFFHGNLESFFGSNLNSKMPDCVLGKDRTAFREKFGESGTYLDWMQGREDMYLVVDFKKPFDATAYEGVGAIWLPHWAARSMYSGQVDKLAILDDMMQRAKKGKLQIEPIK